MLKTADDALDGTSHHQDEILQQDHKDLHSYPYVFDNIYRTPTGQHLAITRTRFRNRTTETLQSGFCCCFLKPTVLLVESK